MTSINPADPSQSPRLPAEIRKLLVVAIGHRSQREYYYNDQDTGREFEIRAMDDGDFFMSELVPNGRCFEANEEGEVIRSWDDPGVRQAMKAAPNEVAAELRRLGIDRLTVFFEGSGFGINTRYQSSLESCAEAIYLALKSNTRYDNTRVLTKQERIALDRQSAAASDAFWVERQVRLELAMANETGLFHGCHDGVGRPLQPEMKATVLAYLNAPSQESWLEIRGKNIAGFSSLWQAWLLVDTNACRGGDEGFPDADTVRIAIRAAVAKYQAEVEARMEKISRGSGFQLVK